jgi:homocitrate synthase NifV
MQVKHWGAQRLRLADTVGIWEPLRCYEVVGTLRSKLDALELAVHTHNDLGMASANAVAAIRAGADCADVTVNGLGERAGNAAIEEVALAIELSLEKESCIALEMLYELSQSVAEYSRRPIPVQKPVTGEAVFSHESGIHGHALLRDRRTYEAFAPELLGRARSDFVIGKHSGTATLRSALTRLGLGLSDSQVTSLLARVRQTAEALNRSLSDQEITTLAIAVC